MLDNTKKVMELAKQIGISLKEVMADGKIGWEDLPKMVPILAKLRPALESAQLVGPELKDMSEAEIVELTNDFAVVLAIFVSAFRQQPQTSNPIQQL